MPRSLRRRRWWVLLACAWVVAVLLSRAAEPPYDRKPEEDVEVSELRAVRGAELERAAVRLAWRRWPPAPAAPSGHLPVVLLHGSPGSHHDFDRLSPPLAERGFALYAPDLPGFGASSRRISDYSTRA